MGGRNGGTNIKHGKPSDVVQTPLWLVDEMITMAGIQPKDRIIDPCCGADNRMLRRICDLGYPNYSFGIDLVESSIQATYGPPEVADFLMTDPRGHIEVPNTFSVALLNPPFSDVGAYQFVKRLFELWLDPVKGRAIAIVPFYVLQQNKSRREWLRRHLFQARILDPNTFDCGRVDAFVCEFRPELPAGMDLYCTKPETDLLFGGLE